MEKKHIFLIILFIVIFGLLIVFYVAKQSQELKEQSPENTAQKFAVTYSATAGGTVVKKSESVVKGSKNIGATYSENTGYIFINYEIISGKCTGNFNQTTGVCSEVNEPLQIRANFTQSYGFHQIKYSTTAGGAVMKKFETVVDGSKNIGTTYNENKGYVFISYEIISGECSGNFDQITGVCSEVNESLHIRANFTRTY